MTTLREQMAEAAKSRGARERSRADVSISVVISSLNERDNLVATVASVKADCPEAEVIVVDDGSTAPEPVATIRNPQRLGGPRSRRLGGLAAKGDVVIFLDAHNALDWETACWFAKRYPEIGPINPSFKPALDVPHKLRTLAEAALCGMQNAECRVQNAECEAERAARVLTPAKPDPLSTLHSALRTLHSAIVYGGCMFATGRSGFTLVHEKGLYGGRWVRRRPDLPAVTLWRTPAMMGAFYAIPRAVLDDFGGWPALPNFHGAQELAVSLLAIAHGVPIYYHSEVALWHLFRGCKSKGEVRPPFDISGWNNSHLGYAAAWRLVLDDAHWNGVAQPPSAGNGTEGTQPGAAVPHGFRARLAAGEGPHGEIPEHVLAQCETDEFNRYRADAQSRFKLSSDELLAELDRQIEQNRDERIQGAEDRALNAGKKILLAITFSADDGTSSNAATLEDKMQILARCVKSAQAAAADKIAVFVVAPTGAMDSATVAMRAEGLRVIPLGVNPGLPLGEARAVREAVTFAQERGYEWIVKICGDVFHPRPNWAKDMVQRAINSKTGAALIAGKCADSGCTVTKVFAARTDFLARTWPTDAEVAAKGNGAVLERLWTANIERLGLNNLWLKIECCSVKEGKAQWWTPVADEFAYSHTHVAAFAETWKMERAS